MKIGADTFRPWLDIKDSTEAGAYNSREKADLRRRLGGESVKLSATGLRMLDAASGTAVEMGGGGGKF